MSKAEVEMMLEDGSLAEVLRKGMSARDIDYLIESARLGVALKKSGVKSSDITEMIERLDDILSYLNTQANGTKAIKQRIIDQKKVLNKVQKHLE